MTAGTAEGRTAGPARTIFFGSGEFAVPILDAIADEPRLRMVAVVTAPDRPAGRTRTVTATPVADRAAALGLPVLKPARVRAPEAVAELAALEPALGVLADYGQIIPQSLLDLPPHGILNVHPSLLPRHRGATPVPATIASGDREAGVSVIRMDAGIDTGPIVASRAWTLDGTETAPDLEARAAAEGATMLVGLLGAWLDGRLTAREQGDEGATTTRPFRREDGRLDPARPARELERLVRAHAPWPGTFVETDLGRIAVLESRAVDAVDGDAAGTFVEHEGRLALATSDGRLVIDQAQREGKRPTSGLDFLRGQRQLVGTSAR